MRDLNSKSSQIAVCVIRSVFISVQTIICNAMLRILQKNLSFFYSSTYVGYMQDSSPVHLGVLLQAGIIVLLFVF